MSAATTNTGIVGGFVPDPGKDFTSTPALRSIAKALDTLAKAKGIVIYGLSGGRTPAHSVEVGGFPDDPHTQGIAADIAVNSQLRASAGKGTLSDADLASVGLYRPFSGANEINHVQLLGDSGGASASDVNAATGAGGGNIVTKAADAVSTGAGAIVDAGAATVDFAKDPAGAIKSALTSVLDTVAGTAGKWLLIGVLVVTGAALAVFGLIKMAGPGPPAPTTKGAA